MHDVSLRRGNSSRSSGRGGAVSRRISVFGEVLERALQVGLERRGRQASGPAAQVLQQVGSGDPADRAALDGARGGLGDAAAFELLEFGDQLAGRVRRRGAVPDQDDSRVVVHRQR